MNQKVVKMKKLLDMISKESLEERVKSNNIHFICIHIHMHPVIFFPQFEINMMALRLTQHVAKNLHRNQENLRPEIMMKSLNMSTTQDKDS